MILVKLGSFMFYRDTVMELIRYAEENFWNADYDETSARILEEYDKLGMSMIYTFTFIVYVATFNYIFAPFFGTVLVFTRSRWQTPTLERPRRATLHGIGGNFLFSTFCK